MLDLGHLRSIQATIAPHTHRTPVWRSDTLSRLSGFEVFLKAELLQKTGSYKPRGMLWALTCMTPEQRARGVITFSAGNAAQGLAYAGRILGAPAVVVMPAAASPTKVQATRGLWRGGHPAWHRAGSLHAVPAARGAPRAHFPLIV